MKKFRKQIAMIVALCMVFVYSLPSTAMAASEENTNDVNKNIDINEEQQQKNETTPLVNYVVVKEPTIKSGKQQQIAVGIGDDGTEISNATILLTNVTTLDTKSIQATTIVNNAVLFETTIDNTWNDGEYKITSLEVEIGEKAFEIDFAGTGLDASFGVNQKINSNADGVIEPEGEITADVLDVKKIKSSEEDINAGDFKIDASSYAAGRNPIVVLDPGHGGSQPGAVANGVNEKEINFKIAQYCKAYLESRGGITVYMTRQGDNTVSLTERVEYAQSVGADLLVSIHNNVGGGTGAEIWVPNANYNKDVHDISTATSAKIMEQLVALGLYNRGSARIKNSTNNGKYPDGSLADYYTVIEEGKLAGIPTMIVEHAFMDNDDDFANFLSSDEKLKELGEADARGIINAIPSFTGTGKYDKIFDAIYYADNNRDIKAVFGYNKSLLLEHFLNYGMAEGRRSIESFDVYSYKNRYYDLRQRFGNDLKSYYMHYLNTGYAEGRQATGCNRQMGGTSTYNGVDYSSIYDYDYYVEHNMDVYRAFNGDDKTIIQHFVNCGMAEGRASSPSFDVKSYKNRYVDLRMVYGNNLVAYYNHYLKYGRYEGRTGSYCPNRCGSITVYGGVNYSSVYNMDDYLRYNGDVRAAFGDNEIAVLAHFVNYGMAEGRRASSNFDVNSYRNRYADLRHAYGNNKRAYYMHYLRYGQYENRQTTGCTVIWGAISSINGIDYSAVYDYATYLRINSDVARVIGNDEFAVLNHFINYGMSEGRLANSAFNVVSYMNRYGDLRSAYGNDYRAYYMHYLNYGKNEGRIAS